MPAELIDAWRLRDAALSNPYDEIPYFSLPLLGTHPDRLEVIARLMGLSPPPSRTARILEVGCASGGNLVPMAAQLPRAELVGIDLSAVQVRLASEWIERAGLTNVRVVQADLTDVDEGLGTFDYIVVHGVYSWVPPGVRAALLTLIRDRLRPTGVAYISYNTQPGWHLRGQVRDMMRYHVGDEADGATACRKALDVVKMVAGGATGGASYQALLQDELALLEHNPPSYYFHDHLSPHNEAFWFHEFVEHLANADLVFLSESMLSSMMTDRFSEATQRALADVGSDVVRLEQYQDYLTNRSFRRSLVVHANAPIDRNVGIARLQHMFVASAVTWSGSDDLRDGVSVRFSGHSDGSFSASVPVVKAMWFELGRAWPHCVSIQDLVARACHAAGVVVDHDSARLCLQNVLSLYGRDFIDLFPRDRPVMTVVSERPVACPVVRSMARTGSAFITTRLHRRLDLSAISRAVLLLLNGQRTVDQIVDDLVKSNLIAQVGDGVSTYAPSAEPSRRRDLTVALVVPALTALARAGALVG